LPVRSLLSLQTLTLHVVPPLVKLVVQLALPDPWGMQMVLLLPLATVTLLLEAAGLMAPQPPRQGAAQAVPQPAPLPHA
jgi:hypothetical protein